MRGLLLVFLLAPPFPAAGLEPAAGRELTVAVVISDKTRKSLRRLSDYYAEKAAHRLRPGSDNAPRFLSELEVRLARGFKSTVKVERAEEAARAGADLVAFLDVEAEAKHPWLGKGTAKARVVLTARLTSLDGKRSAEVRGEAEREQVVEGRVMVRDDLYRELDAALGAASAAFQESLTGSRELAELLGAVKPAAAAGGPMVRALHSDIDEPSYRLHEDPRLFAVLVAVEGPSARYARRDAAAVKDQLIGLGVPERHMRVLQGAKAQRRELDRTLRGWLAGQVRSESTVFFYYAGAAAEPSKDGEGLLLDGGTAYPLQRLYESLSGLPSRRSFVILEGSAGAEPVPERLSVLTAGSPGTLSPSKRTRARLFTYHFLRV